MTASIFQGKFSFVLESAIDPGAGKAGDARWPPFDGAADILVDLLRRGIDAAGRGMLPQSGDGRDFAVGTMAQPTATHSYLLENL